MPEFTGNLRLPRLNSAPASPSGGEAYYNVPDAVAYFYNGATWVAMGGGPKVVSARIYKGSAQSPGNGNRVAVALSSADYENPTTFGDTANDRLVIPSTGIYTVTGYIEWPAATGGHRSGFLMRNATEIRSDRKFPSVAVAIWNTMTVTRQFTAGDLITMEALHNATGTQALGTGVNSTSLEAVLHGALGP